MVSGKHQAESAGACITDRSGPLGGSEVGRALEPVGFTPGRDGLAAGGGAVQPAANPAVTIQGASRVLNPIWLYVLTRPLDSSVRSISCNSQSRHDRWLILFERALLHRTRACVYHSSDCHDGCAVAPCYCRNCGSAASGDRSIGKPSRFIAFGTLIVNFTGSFALGLCHNLTTPLLTVIRMPSVTSASNVTGKYGYRQEIAGCYDRIERCVQSNVDQVESALDQVAKPPEAQAA